MSVALEVRGLTRQFGGLVAVDNASFEIRRGEILGFIGPNGAGKTTTMRVCATLDLPDAGDVFIDGESVVENPRGVRKRLGFMPDSYGAYVHTTVADYLDFFARTYGLRGKDRAKMLAFVKDFTGLIPLENKHMTALSKGMKQRLCLAKTLLHDPALLILDEPAAGLDPHARVELRELVKALAGLGKAVMISSHILTELAQICTSVAVIEAGRIRATGTVEDVIRRASKQHQRVFVRSLSPTDVILKFVLESPGVESAHTERGGVMFEFSGAEDGLARLVRAMVEAGLDPIEFSPKITDLEDVFLSLTAGTVQ